MQLNKSPGNTNWLSQEDQQFWFDKFKLQDFDGLKLSQFEEFLRATVYKYFATFPSSNKRANGERDDEFEFNHQQVMQLFKAFDVTNDHVIDRCEFEHLCQKWLDRIYRPSCGLLVVDVQNDFIDGSLALINGPAGQDGAEVVPVINDLIRKCNFKAVVYTQDWHPPDHIGFHANLHLRKHKLKTNPADNEQSSSATNCVNATNNNNNEDAKENSTGASASREFKLKKLASRVQVFDTVLFDDGQLEQKLWPIHCVRNSWGAQLHPNLINAPNAVHIQKGTLSNVDAYSAFWDNKRSNETGLRHELQSRKIDDLFVCGLALDYCVAASALDAAKAGFQVFVVEDACRGIDCSEIERRKEELVSNGVFMVQSNQVKGFFARHHLQNNNTDKQADCLSIDLRPSSTGGACQHLSVSVAEVDDNLFDRNLIKTVCFNRAF